MTNLLKQPYEMMSFDDFEEALLDKPANEKWELLGGRVIRGMVGARWEHSEIVSNIETAIRNHLRAAGLPCRTFRETFWLKKRIDTLAAFPDVMVHCGPLEPGQTSVDDPQVLFEVVSKGSGQRDRVEKKSLYQALPSVEAVALVALDSAEVDFFSRAGGMRWDNEIFRGLEVKVPLRSIGLDLPLAEIYRGVIEA